MPFFIFVCFPPGKLIFVLIKAYQRWVVKLDRACLLRQLSGSNPDISQTNTKRATRQKQRSGQHTLARQKITQKICLTQIWLKKRRSLIPRDTTFKNLFFFSSLFNLLTALNVSKCVRRKGTTIHQINGLM